jgi:hypothetical protein
MFDPDPTLEALIGTVAIPYRETGLGLDALFYLADCLEDLPPKGKPEGLSTEQQQRLESLAELLMYLGCGPQVQALARAQRELLGEWLWEGAVRG